MLFILYIIGGIIGLAAIVCFFIMCDHVASIKKDMAYIAKKLHDRDYQ